MTVKASEEMDPVTDRRLVIVDSPTFLCACLHHPPVSLPPVFTILCFQRRRTDRVPEVRTGGGGGGGMGALGGGLEGGDMGGGMAQKKLTRQLGLGRPL